MDNADISRIGMFFQEELRKKCLEKGESHNHPPIRQLVPGCPYCKAHGNHLIKSK